MHGDEDDSTLVKDLGQVEARNMDDAMRRGFFCYVSVGLDASHYAERFFGGRSADYPTALFSVVELGEDDLINEAKHFSPEEF